MPDELQSCPHCHQMHSPGTPTCPVTGQPLICTTCGSSLPLRGDECPNCGAILTRPVAQVAPVSSPVEVPPVQAETLPQEVEAEVEVLPAVEIQPAPPPVPPKQVTIRPRRKQKTALPIPLEPKVEARPGQLCPSCGKSNSIDAIYCAYCAYRLKEVPQEKKVGETPKKISVTPKDVVLGFSFLPITVDVTLRWFLLSLWQHNILNDWVFWLGQIFVLSLGILVWVIFRYDKIRQEAGISSTDFNLSTKNTTWSVLFSLSVVVWGTYIAIILSAGWVSWLRVLWTIGIFLLYAFYILILYVTSVVAPPQKAATKKRGWVQKADRVLLGMVIFLCLMNMLQWLISLPGATLTAPTVTTATFTPTRMPTSTLLPTQTPIPTLTPVWDFKLTDTFDSNQYGWELKNNMSFNGGTVSLDIQNGVMTWLINNSLDLCWSEIPDSMPLATDFDVSADFKRVSGSEDSDFGLVFRGQSTSDKYYFAINDSNRTYGFFVHQQNSWTNFILWTSSSVIRTGGVNRLRVTGQGSHFTFYINDQKVDSFDDSRLSNGYFGLAGEPRGTTATLKLNVDNFELHGNK